MHPQPVQQTSVVLLHMPIPESRKTRKCIQGSIYDLPFGERSEVAKDHELPRGGPGACLPGTFFEMNMR